jgi:polar amino acid transport system substrate-binding protein
MEDKEDFPHLMGSGEAIEAKNPGVAVEFAQLIAKKLDLDLQIKRMDWGKCIKEEVKNGTIDGAIPAGFSKERDEIAAFPKKGDQPDLDKSYTNMNYSVYIKEGSDIDWDGKAFIAPAGTKCGTKTGYSIIPRLKEAGFDVVEASTEENLKKLAAGEIQMVVELELQADRKLAQNPDFAVAIEKLSTPFLSRLNYLILSKAFVSKNPALAEKIWEASGELRKNDYSRLVRKYMSL